MTAEVALLIALAAVVAAVGTLIAVGARPDSEDRRERARTARLIATTISRATDHQLEIPTVRRRARK